MSIDFKKLLSDFTTMDRVTKYLLGAKAPANFKPVTIKAIDCSGATLYWLRRCADIMLPDGSMNQLAWCEKNLRKLKRYEDVQYAKDDASRLFIAFIVPNKLQRYLNSKDGRARGRHVFLVYMGMTMESYGGHGVGSLPWNKRKSVNCFEVKNG